MFQKKESKHFWSKVLAISSLQPPNRPSGWGLKILTRQLLLQTIHGALGQEKKLKKEKIMQFPLFLVLKGV